MIGIFALLRQLGKLAHYRQEDDQARVLFLKSLVLAQHTGDRAYIVRCLVNLAEIFAANDEVERGVQILGAVCDQVQSLFPGPLFGERETRIDFDALWILLATSWTKRRLQRPLPMVTRCHLTRLYTIH